MKFEGTKYDRVESAYLALEFLRQAYEENKIGEIENMEDVFDALDISGALAYAYERLACYHIDL